MSGLGERIEPLHALLYNCERIPDLAGIVAPPYDLIDERRQDELYRRSPYNVVRLELGREADRYGAATRTLEDWRRDGILVPAPRPAIYLYTQIFALDGKKLRREGLAARVRLEEFAAGRILPHERTFPAAKEDRLKLLTALRANVSPVFGLYPRANPELAELIASVRGREPMMVLIDDLGIENQLRAIEDPAEIGLIQRSLAAPRILIADGHHRYETALNYRRMRRAAEGDPAGLKGYDYTMMTLVACDDPGLVILPTHRVVHHLDAQAAAAFYERAGRDFEIDEFRDGDAMRSELARRGRGTIGVALRAGAASWLLRLRDRRAMEQAMPEAPPAVRELDVSILHALVFDRIFGLRAADVRKGGNIEYTIDGRGALEAVSAGRADGAFLMNPPAASDVERVSDSGATMPEKSTYFHPKLLTGFAINPIDAE
jgi:uncharacterized protein (DUF1015 family)